MHGNTAQDSSLRGSCAFLLVKGVISAVNIQGILRFFERDRVVEAWNKKLDQIRNRIVQLEHLRKERRASYKYSELMANVINEDIEMLIVLSKGAFYQKEIQEKIFHLQNDFRKVLKHTKEEQTKNIRQYLTSQLKSINNDPVIILKKVKEILEIDSSKAGVLPEVFMAD